MFFVIIFILANIISFGILIISLARFKNHKSRYPLPEDRSVSLFKFIRVEAVIIVIFILLILVSVLFAYLLFWEDISNIN